jgi:hypothetical protein
MKEIIVILLIFVSLEGYSQKNEIVAYTGFTGYQLTCDQSSVFQIKYERKLWRSISLQSGLRYHSEIQQSSYNDISRWIQYAYNSYKLDLTFVVAPINKERFKLKAGIGFDVGKSRYYYAGNGVIEKELVLNDQGASEWRYLQYRRHNIDEIIDLGVHFVFQGSYYFKNNLFISSQILINNVFDEEVANQKYSWTLYRESPICLSVGLGFRF